MSDMTSRVKKGGLYGFSLVNGKEVEGVAQEYGLSGNPIHIEGEGRRGGIFINADHVAYMWVIDESAAEPRRFVD